MGASSSKTASESTPVEKTAEKPSARQTVYSASSSTHHATDRLQRISAEAALTPAVNAIRHQIQHRRSMPEHETTHAEINISALKAWDSVALDDPTSRLAAMTLHNTVIRDSIRKRDTETADHHIFSHVIPMQGTPIVNQLSSGRCWLFATTNVIRIQVIKELNLKEFELSQSYLAFWDKLEKSNTFLENAIELADRALDDRIFGFLKTAPTNDGGQWDMVTNLIKKYGLVPKSIFPESYNSSNSSQINWLLTVKLREYALELRELKTTTRNALKKAATMDQANIQSHVLRAVRSKKDEQMAEVYRMMVIALGVPPKPDEEFTYEYYDKNDKFHAIKTTAKEFLDKYTGSFDPSGACSLVNDPRRPYNKLITVDRLQNVWGGQPVLYVNTSTSQMKASVIASIKAGLPVFFGCDVGQYSARSGIMDTRLYDYELAFGIKLGLTKAERLEMGESSMTHAMVITGVHLNDRGEPVRYRVENSWGPDAGEKGYMVMSDAWFDQFVYQVVIRKQHMPNSLWTLFENGVNDETDVLPCYDPMGSLASSTSAMEVDSVPMLTSEAAKDEDDDSSSIPEDEYEIETILSHEVGHFRKNEIAYLVSWKGYGPEHNSWVKEGDAENAPDMINSYWQTASKEGVAQKANGKGWTGAKSTKRVFKKEASEDSSSIKSRKSGRSNAQEEQLAKKRARVAVQHSYTRSGVDMTAVTAQDLETVSDISEKQFKRLSAEEQSRIKKQIDNKRYLGMADWENVVRHVETVERLESGKLVVYLVFDNGERYAYESAVANHRCPQKVLQFYESRLRFKPEAAQLPPLVKASIQGQQPARDADPSDAVADVQTSEEQAAPEEVVEGVMDEQVAPAEGEVNETIEQTADHTSLDKDVEQPAAVTITETITEVIQESTNGTAEEPPVAVIEQSTVAVEADKDSGDAPMDSSQT